MFVEILKINNLRCGAVWCELNYIWMRCGAACGQGLRTQRRMRMPFLLSAPSLTYTICLLRNDEIIQASQKFRKILSN